MSSPAGAKPPTHAHVPTEGREREEFIAMLKAIRQEGLSKVDGVSKVVKMLQRLENEAEHAKRDTARVAANRAYTNNIFQAAHVLHAIEQGTESQPRSGPVVQILVAMPNGESRAPNGLEMKSILADISDSVRAELAPSTEE